ncbi:tetratricopeptide repeat protein [Oceanicaulis alexandrii]|uniref:tetratricopeptide repeat protein n=1 Tax=Oceanicaulis alexandrii TaxID=153233 RepID=UPI0003B5FB14|nr:tetratricopeptide repeat protein [Oceanicaulis alexandrii]
MAPVLIVSVLLATAWTPPPSDQDRLETCLSAIQDDAEDAYEDALTWRHQGGGWPAEHCVSLALIALGQEAPGALRLREAALDAEMASDPSRAIMLGQSGDAFLAAEEYDQALISFTVALDFAPHDAGLLAGLARTHLALEDFNAAEDAASLALSQDDARPLIWRLRAEARLGLQAYDEALSDIETARALSPEDIDILVLRGRIIDARRTG